MNVTSDFLQWSKILVYIHQNIDNKITEFNISKDMNMCTSSVSKNIDYLRYLGLVRTEKKGRNIIFILTTKGTKIAEHLNAIMSLMKNGV